MILGSNVIQPGHFAALRWTLAAVAVVEGGRLE